MKRYIWTASWGYDNHAKGTTDNYRHAIRAARACFGTKIGAKARVYDCNGEPMYSKSTVCRGGKLKWIDCEIEGTEK